MLGLVRVMIQRIHKLRLDEVNVARWYRHVIAGSFFLGEIHDYRQLRRFKADQLS